MKKLLHKFSRLCCFTSFRGLAFCTSQKGGGAMLNSDLKADTLALINDLVTMSAGFLTLLTALTNYSVKRLEYRKLKSKKSRASAKRTRH